MEHSYSRLFPDCHEQESAGDSHHTHNLQQRPHLATNVQNNHGIQSQNCQRIIAPGKPILYPWQVFELALQHDDSSLGHVVGREIIIHPVQRLRAPVEFFAMLVAVFEPLVQKFVHVKHNQ
jgi:hypothetical protein